MLGAGHIRREQRATQVPCLSGWARLVLMHDFTGEGTKGGWAMHRKRECSGEEVLRRWRKILKK